LGIKFALSDGADYIWLLNNDTIVDRECLTSMVSLAEKDIKTGLISPIIRYFNEKEKIQFNGSCINCSNFRVRNPVIKEKLCNFNCEQYECMFCGYCTAN